ncbi:hypothetical protein CVT24_009654 [Panaeolus cyanescens]|uniref:Uncharacterized protein n=1 Tax=Panaeolus cyanescens TaxID=181874 RepID=A0A409Y9X9_9AGAR|nr:hypothetical protein CVT24_009654 [Panaeolus cyanescens]
MSSEPNLPDRYTQRPSTRMYLNPQLTFKAPDTAKKPSSPTKSPKKQKKAASGTKPKSGSDTVASSLRKIKGPPPNSVSPTRRRVQAPSYNTYTHIMISEDNNRDDVPRAPMDRSRTIWKHHNKIIPPPDMPPAEEYFKSINREVMVPAPVIPPEIPAIIATESEMAKLFASTDADDWSGYMNTLLSQSEDTNMDEAVDTFKH